MLFWCIVKKLIHRKWSNRSPVVIVPTKYYNTPTSVFEDLRISMVIWANHSIRSSITAIQKITKKIFDNQNVACIQDEIAPITEVFRLQKADELIELEKKYLPNQDKNTNVIILAATQGDLGVFTKDIPKTLVKVKNGMSILENQLRAYSKVGIENICLVRGFKKNKIKNKHIKYIDNNDYSNTYDLYSLYLARNNIQENTIISYGDIIFKEYILNILLDDPSDISIIVDAEYFDGEKDSDFIVADIPYSKEAFYSKIKLIKATKINRKDKINGEFIGLWKVKGKGVSLLKSELDILSHKENFKKLTILDLFDSLQKKVDISIKYITGSWLDIDTITDLQYIDKI